MPGPDALPTAPDANQVPADFLALVRDALAHLYDLAHLQRHPLLALTRPRSGPSRDAGRALRTLLLDTLEQLNPGAGVSRNDKEWRPYGILTRRYVDGYSMEDTARELGISVRQFQREHQRALGAAAAILWRRRQAQVPAPGAPLPGGAGDPLQEEVESLGLAPERLDLGGLAASVLHSGEALAHECGVRIEARPPEGAVSIWADAALTRQALLGVVGALLRLRPARVEMAWRGARPEAVVELRLWPPLPERGPAQVDELRERLALVDRLMAAQGGRVELIVTDGAMHGVRLTFPPAHGGHVLLIDDNERVLQLFERYLVAEGYVVTGLNDAARALAAARQARPDAIVLDLMMRQVDGWQLLEHLRADPELQGVPIVVCSVLNEAELALALGARRYLKKPVSQEEMATALREVLAGYSRSAPRPEAP